MSSKKYRSSLIQKARKYRVPSSVTLNAVKEVLMALDCPRSLAVWIIIRDDPDQLKTLEFNPLWYNTTVDVRDSYLATKLVWKSSFLKTSISSKAAAYASFRLSEEKCKETNRRFRSLISSGQYTPTNASLLFAMTRKIETILAGYSPEDLFDKANWGPGVTTQIKGSEATATNKFQYETGVTRDLYYLIQPCLAAGYPIWAEHLLSSGFPKFETGNKVCTVPKDAFTDRVIAVEPGINLWFQKSCGLMIRERLMERGIDLDHQDRNQHLAMIGSYTGHLATVDFSSASDTISTELIREVLPPHWFTLLDSCRSHFGKIEGVPVKWEKFSSMGNGFTFELESLIFYSAAISCCEYLRLNTSEVSVYGDDVILPVEAFDLYSSFCEFLGFSVNRKKSFTSSYFRESCGAHYYEGTDVKPIFIKKIARTVFELFRLANQIRELAHRRCNNLCCDKLLKPAWLSAFTAVPRDLRPVVPFGKGDGGFIGNLDEAVPKLAREDKKFLQFEGYLFKQFIHTGVTRYSEGIGLLLDRYRNTSVQEYGNNYTLKGRTRVSYIETLASQWYDLGPWI